MVDYRVYLLNRNGLIISGYDVSCDDDQDARVQARRMLDGTNSDQAEVWAGARCVGKVLVESTFTAPS